MLSNFSINLKELNCARIKDQKNRLDFICSSDFINAVGGAWPENILEVVRRDGETYPSVDFACFSRCG